MTSWNIDSAPQKTTLIQKSEAVINCIINLTQKRTTRLNKAAYLYISSPLPGLFSAILSKLPSLLAVQTQIVYIARSLNTPKWPHDSCLTHQSILWAAEKKHCNHWTLPTLHYSGVQSNLRAEFVASGNILKLKQNVNGFIYKLKCGSVFMVGCDPNEVWISVIWHRTYCFTWGTEVKKWSMAQFLKADGGWFKKAKRRTVIFFAFTL